ncbi:hypothetical protein AMAG_10253 [Allomyces macrogynus ATCC 38327]|uniref:Cytochrome P450 n=1 Tax=Allomyces macrogynus (strain ATCC 38327) TaxID=578462 RepID=A0A0L0SUC5_ALLM3|nr:hypothetical protein AMAG_10253 [Allomyces macrogynus ATCC 38327]|eukprot:KNE65970.1 hypothetical protein AMAG_10253 [Allomyces macrogynus ATCC 38327]
MDYHGFPFPQPRAMDKPSRCNNIVAALERQFSAIAHDARRRGLPVAESVPAIWAPWMFGKWTVIVTHPEDARTVLTQGVDVFDKPVFPAAPLLLGNSNIVFSPHEDWKRHRKVVNPAFRRGWSAAHFGDLGQQLFVRLDDAAARGDAVDMKFCMSRLTLEAIAISAFGEPFNALKDANSPMLKAFEAMVANGMNPLVVFARPIAKLTPMWAELKQQVDTFNLHLLTIIARKEAALKARKASGQAASIDDMDLLDLLVDAAEQEGDYTHEDMRNAVVFFLAGHDTTTTALTAAIYLLDMHPEAQQRARAEVLAVLGCPSTDLSAADFPSPTSAETARLPYLTAVIKEAMRLYPSIPHIPPRVTTSTVTLRDGTTLPPGSRIMVAAAAMQRAPWLWDRHNEFDPDRFLGIDADAMHASAHDFKWIPFGAGQRVCLGQAMAVMEMRIVLAMVLARYEWTVAGDDEALRGTPRTSRAGMVQMRDVQIMFKRLA